MRSPSSLRTARRLRLCLSERCGAYGRRCIDIMEDAQLRGKLGRRSGDPLYGSLIAVARWFSGLDSIKRAG